MSSVKSGTMMRRHRSQPEYDLQKTVCQWLLLAGTEDLIYFAIPNGLVSDPASVSRMKVIGLLPGVADICVVPKGGRTHFMEVKAKGGRQSGEQKKFEAACIANGAAYAVVYNIDEAIRILTEWGAIRAGMTGKWGAIPLRRNMRAA